MTLVRMGIFPFLQLPGEIRNKIYHFALVKKHPFSIKLQFAPRDTALLRVNKQIFSEAANIFYDLNTFRIPEALFIGRPILDQIEGFHHVTLWRLAFLRKLVIDIPVSGLIRVLTPK